jgi:hypothetical protein
MSEVKSLTAHKNALVVERYTRRSQKPSPLRACEFESRPEHEDLTREEHCCTLLMMFDKGIKRSDGGTVYTRCLKRLA